MLVALRRSLRAWAPALAPFFDHGQALVAAAQVLGHMVPEAVPWTASQKVSRQKVVFRKGGKKNTQIPIFILNRWTLEFSHTPFSIPPFPSWQVSRRTPVELPARPRAQRDAMGFSVVAGCRLRPAMIPAPTISYHVISCYIILQHVIIQYSML